MPIVSVALTTRFKRDFKRLELQLQQRVEHILKFDLKPWPGRGSLRHHTLAGFRPTIHVIDVSSNHSHQITFVLNGDVARLLRVATHVEIDRDPQ